jgi:hypothetical protein
VLRHQNRRYGRGSGKAKSALIATAPARIFSDQYLEGAVLRAEKNGTPFEEFEEIVFEKLLTPSSQPAEE